MRKIGWGVGKAVTLFFFILYDEFINKIRKKDLWGYCEEEILWQKYGSKEIKWIKAILLYISNPKGFWAMFLSLAWITSCFTNHACDIFKKG